MRDSIEDYSYMSATIVVVWATAVAEDTAALWRSTSIYLMGLEHAVVSVQGVGFLTDELELLKHIAYRRGLDLAGALPDEPEAPAEPSEFDYIDESIAMAAGYNNVVFLHRKQDNTYVMSAGRALADLPLIGYAMPGGTGKLPYWVYDQRPSSKVSLL